MKKAGWLRSGDEVYVFTKRENYPEIHAECFDMCFNTIEEVKAAAKLVKAEDIVIFKLKLTRVREHFTSVFRLDPEPMAVAPPPDEPPNQNLPTGVKPPCTR